LVRALTACQAGLVHIIHMIKSIVQAFETARRTGVVDDDFVGRLDSEIHAKQFGTFAVTSPAPSPSHAVSSPAIPG